MKKTLLMVSSFLFYVNCHPESRLITANIPDGTAGLEDVVSNNAGNTGDATIHTDTKKQTDTLYTPQPSVDTAVYNKPDTTNYETTSNDTNDDSTKITTVEDCVSYVVERLTEWDYTVETNDGNWQRIILDYSTENFVEVEAQILVKIPEDKIGKMSEKDCKYDLYLACKVPEPEYKGLSSECPPYVEILLPKGEAMINYALSKSLEQWLE